MAYADVWMKNPARFILEYCQLKHFNVMTNYCRNCGKCLDQKLWPQNYCFSYTETLESLKTLYSSIIVSLRENWLKNTKNISVTQGIFFQFLYSL